MLWRSIGLICVKLEVETWNTGPCRECAAAILQRCRGIFQKCRWKEKVLWGMDFAGFYIFWTSCHLKGWFAMPFFTLQLKKRYGTMNSGNRFLSDDPFAESTGMYCFDIKPRDQGSGLLPESNKQWKYVWLHKKTSAMVSMFLFTSPSCLLFLLYTVNLLYHQYPYL